MKRTYTVRLTSDDWTSECDFQLTEDQRDLLLFIAAGFAAQATFSVDHLVSITPSAAQQGEVA